jgi:DNA repair exonuclease SbcCD ATPase subunit
MSSPKIRRISIRNLRRVQALDLSFVAPNDKPVSQFVIAGPNGSGKTTVLEAILFALGRDDLLKRDSDHERWSAGFPAGARVEIELERDGRSETYERRDPIGISTIGSSAYLREPRVALIEYFSS